MKKKNRNRYVNLSDKQLENKRQQNREYRERLKSL